MKILIMGGARYIGKFLIEELVRQGHDVTIANRGTINDNFGDSIKREIITERNDRECLTKTFRGKTFDIIIDNLAFDSWNVKLLLDSVRCKRYIFISSAGVYFPNKHKNTVEDEFDPMKYKLIISSRGEGLDYVTGKKLAEAMAYQCYPQLEPTSVRLPLVIGINDYTGRLKNYVDCIVNEKEMFIDNLDAQISFVSAEEAGRFIAFLADSDFRGPINGCTTETMTVREICAYVENKCGKEIRLSDSGIKGGYNGEVSHSLSNKLANDIGFHFSNSMDWIYPILDYYIEECMANA